MSETSGLLVERQGAVVWLRFNRPERKNALTLAMYAQAADALLESRRDPEVKVLAISGSEDSFCAGNDLADFMKGPELAADHPVLRFMGALQECEKPLVALVRGPAVGIGATLLLHCDLVYAAEGAYLQFPFVNLGLCPEFAVSYLLPRLVGQAKAAELLFLGERLEAEQAKALGLINEVLPDAQLNVQVQGILERLIAKPPAALRVTKALLKQHQQTGIASAMTEEVAAFTERLASPECCEALQAFFDKRPADFSHFR